MPSPTGFYVDRTITQPTCTNPIVAALQPGLTSHSVWGTTDGTALNLTFSFPTVGAVWEPAYYGPVGAVPVASGLVPFAEVHKATARLALAQWGNVANLNLTEVGDTATSVGDIRFAFSTGIAAYAGDGVAGFGYYPDDTPIAGDVWLATEQAQYIAAGNKNLLLHELGHTLGLKHPFEEVPGQSRTLATEYSNGQYSLEAYQQSPNYGLTSPSTPMMYDILAMQEMYGANMTYKTGDDLYEFFPSITNPVIETLWDAGGNDTISAKAFTNSVLINLNGGTFSTIATDQPIHGTDAIYSLYPASSLVLKQNIGIAFGAVIENAVGGSSDDTLVGNAVNNVFTGNAGNDSMDGAAGNDTMDGGTGIDTAIFNSVLSKSTRSYEADGTIVNLSVDGIDTLKNVERLQFTDKRLAFDLSPAQHAGQALEFIGMMAPSLISTPKVVGDILGIFDKGSSMHDICQLALDVGLVKSFAGSSSNTALAAMVFRNLIGSEGDSADINMLTGYMDGRSANYSQAEFMTVIAGLDVNQTHIGLVGLQQTGIEFA